MTCKLSVIIPARNEESTIAGAIESVLEAIEQLQKSCLCSLQKGEVEIIVVDNNSEDKTKDIVLSYQKNNIVKLIRSDRLKAPCARNDGAYHSNGKIIIFMDSDTRISKNVLIQVVVHCENNIIAGIGKLKSLEGGVKAFLWWTFWNNVRRLPISKAKAMPAFMFCTRNAFDKYGPFDEEVAIGEEWPILAGVYSKERKNFIYDKNLIAYSSNRRMELQTFGYIANLWKYIWAILHISGRRNYTDKYRINTKKHNNNIL